MCALNVVEWKYEEAENGNTEYLISVQYLSKCTQLHASGHSCYGCIIKYILDEA